MQDLRFDSMFKNRTMSVCINCGRFPGQWHEAGCKGDPRRVGDREDDEAIMRTWKPFWWRE